MQNNDGFISIFVYKESVFYAIFAPQKTKNRNT